MVLPATLLVGFVTVYVVCNTFIESLGYIPKLSFTEITLNYYRELFSNSVFIESLYFSFKVAFISAILATILGVYLGYYISKSCNGFISVLYRIPILLSYVAAAVLIYNTYSDKGLLYHLLSLVGFSKINMDLIYNSNGIGVILLNIFKGLPFIAFCVAPIFIKADKNYKFVAQNLGCSSLNYIFKILLPLAKRSIFTSFLIIFNFNMFTYEGFYYLGPSKPISIGVYAYKTYLNSDLTNRVYGMAINMIMILISILLCFLYYKMINSERKGDI